MDSVIMTTPGMGNRLRPRRRSGMNASCARNSKQIINHLTYPMISSSHYYGHHANSAVNGYKGMRRESARPAFHKSGSFSSSRLDVSPICDARGSPPVFENGGKKAEAEIASAGSRLNRKLSREALQAWFERVGPRTKRAPADTVQPLFNDLHLYPTKTQVFEMLVCAKQCARRCGVSLSFGEFCVFAAELRRRPDGRRTSSSKSDSVNSEPPPQIKPVVATPGELCRELKNCTENGTVPEVAHPYEVFLGGSCNPTTWRGDIAIPTLEKMGITYFNPQVADWSLELIDIEHRAKQSAKVLFFVLDAETRAAAAAVEAAHLAANTRPLVLVLQPYKRGQRIGGEIVSDQEYLDLSRGQALLQEVAERRSLPVFTELRAALERTQHLLRGGTLNRPAQFPTIASHLMKLKRDFDAADEHGSGSLTPNQTLAAIKAFNGLHLTLERLEDLVQACALSKGNESWGQEVPRNPSANNGVSRVSSFNGEQRQLVDFELFCSILAEIMADAGYSEDTKFNSTSKSSNQSAEATMNGHPDQLSSAQASVKNGSSTSPSVVMCSNVTVCRRRTEKLEWKVRQNRMSAESAEQSDDGSHSSKDGSTTPTSGSSGKPARKLSVFIPKLTVTNGSFDASENDALTPQTSKRLDSLAEQVRDEPVALRDVYLGGSCPLRSSWRNDTVIPLLQRHNLSYYAPAMNDYSRMFSAPPYTPASPAQFTFDNPASLRTPTRSQEFGSSFAIRKELSTEQITTRDSTVVHSRSSGDMSSFAATEEVITRQSFDVLSKRSSIQGVKSNRIPVNDLDRIKNRSKVDSFSRDRGLIDQNVSNIWVMTADTRNNQTLVEFNDQNKSRNIVRLQSSEDKIVSANNNSSRLMKSKSVDEGGLILKDSTRENSSEVYSFRAPHKHEGSPVRDNNQPEKKPKYSSEAAVAPSRVDRSKDFGDEVEIRRKNDGPYSLHGGGDNRLSTSDFYLIPENASPAPFRGMFDDRQVMGSRVLLFGVTGDTRCLAPMVLAAHCIGLRKKSVVLCVQLLQQTEGLSERAVKDYNRGRLYLIDLAKREGVPVFDNLEAATKCVIKKLQDKDY